MTESVDRVCTTCVFCLRDDYGYSNYTCEGTTLACLAGLNPVLEDKEEPYGAVTPELAAALDVAKVCPKYRFGAPASLDVDRDGISYSGPVTVETILSANYAADAEVAELLAARLNNAS